MDLGEVHIANVVRLRRESERGCSEEAVGRTRTTPTLSLFLICPPVHSWVSILKTSPEYKRAEIRQLSPHESEAWLGGVPGLTVTTGGISGLAG